MHRYGNFAAFFCNQAMKKVLERTVLKFPFQDGAPIQRAILGGTLERAPCGCPLSPGARGFAHPEPIGVTPLDTWLIESP